MTVDELVVDKKGEWTEYFVSKNIKIKIDGEVELDGESFSLKSPEENPLKLLKPSDPKGEATINCSGILIRGKIRVN
jgi:hypothetical protein